MPETKDFCHVIYYFNHKFSLLNTLNFARLLHFQQLKALFLKEMVFYT